MLPTVSIFGYDVGTYTICSVIGMMVASLYVFFRVKGRSDLDSVQLINLAAISGLGAFFGAHILFAFTKRNIVIMVISDPSRFFTDFEQSLQVLLNIFGGMVFYGGLIGGLIAGIYYSKHLKHMNLDTWLYADVYAPAIPLFHMFGRVGCFLGGCCYGIENKWGFVYHSAPIPESNGVVRLPIQLIEATGNLLLFLFLHILSKRSHRKGVLMPSYIAMYSIMRFTLEYYRGDSIRGFYGCFSTSQWISIMLLIVSVVVLGIIWKKDRPSGFDGISMDSSLGLRK
ncbi:MAG: prolipoprotein diacylglyceryl transferase [Lachnospiraceae bacterium]|nr:prolipoprotein diacylglyceryl transferase [Lachnospiraceae bacterium]